MANNIIIRKAKNDYVCDCCGKIIKSGTEYLDKVILHDGKSVRHERYHDECPKDKIVELFQKIKDNEFQLPVASDGIKYWAVGISSGKVIVVNWDSNGGFEVSLDEFLKKYQWY